VKNRGLSPISHIARWRQDLAPDAADRLADVEALVDE